jgi:hypothetical protein
VEYDTSLYPLDPEKRYGEVPPVIFIVAEPFAIKQSGLTVGNDINPIKGTSLTFTLFVTIHPLLSVIVTE